MLEAAPDMARESEKEWYFGNADKERRGPYSFEEVGKKGIQCAIKLARVKHRVSLVWKEIYRQAMIS